MDLATSTLHMCRIWEHAHDYILMHMSIHVNVTSEPYRYLAAGTKLQTPPLTQALRHRCSKLLRAESPCMHAFARCMHRDAKHEETLDGEHVEDAPMAAVSTVPPQACIVRRFHTRKLDAHASTSAELHARNGHLLRLGHESRHRRDAIRALSEHLRRHALDLVVKFCSVGTLMES